VTNIDISQIAPEKWPVADVHPYPHNNKKHPPKQIEMLAKSIQTQGLLDPIAVDEGGVIISGHGRFEACKKLGMTQVTVRVLRGISEDQARALRIAANKTVSNEYDTEMLQRELERLNDVGFDLTSLGFDDKELSMLTVDIGEIDDDAITMDIAGAVETHEADVQNRAAEADKADVRIDQALGFKTIPLAEQKTVTRFLAVVEEQTGGKGAEALLIHMRQVLSVA
jgi:ParB-like chromosome segregation protein Spo0J